MKSINGIDVLIAALAFFGGRLYQHVWEKAERRRNDETTTRLRTQQQRSTWRKQ